MSAIFQDTGSQWIDIPAAEALDHAEICAANDNSFANDYRANAAIWVLVCVAPFVAWLAINYWSR